MSPLPMLSGILGLPALDAHQVQEQFDRVDAVVIGLPWDGGTAGLPGQRHGPEIVRKFSPNLGFSLDAESRLQGVRDPVSGAKLLGYRRIFDLGDLGGVPIDPRLDRLTYYRAVEDTALRAAQLATVSVFLGGDHSVSAATIVGLSKALGEPLRLVCFDAHCDVGPVAQEVDSYEQLTHANFLSYLASVHAVSSVDVVGVRAALPDSHFPLPKGVQCHASAKSLPPTEPALPTYLSIDVDVLSPEAFPATGHPEPGGRDLGSLINELSRVCKSSNIIGIDIVETTYSDHSSESAGRTVSAILLAVLRATLGDAYEAEEAPC